MVILSSELLYIPEKLYYGWEGKYNLSSHLNSLGGGFSFSKIQIMALSVSITHYFILFFTY